MTEDEILKEIKNRLAKELKDLIGEGNLLEVLNIYSGAFQNTVSINASIEYIDSRNHDYLLKLRKEDEGELSSYFNKRLSLQGLFLVYEKAYKLLQKDSKKILRRL